MLLREHIPFEYDIVEATEEEKNNGVLLHVKGKSQTYDIENANKRIYSEGLWDKQLNNETVLDRLTNRAMVGELDHPQSGTTTMSKISHVVTEIEKRDDNVIHAAYDILNTPMGQIAETLFRAKVRVGTSSRGDGTTESKGGKEYVNEDNYKLETFDLVLKPSTPDAYLTEEEQTQEDHRIVESVSELVKISGDPRVLLESYKIISSIPSSDEQVALSEAIQKKLAELYVKLSETETKSNPEEDPNMTKEYDQQKVIELARELAAKNIAELENVNKDVVAKLNEQIAEISKGKEELQKQYEELQKELTEGKVKLETLEKDKTDITELQKNHKAAEDLLEATLEELDKLKETAKRYDAAERLLEAILRRRDEDVLVTKVESLVIGVPEDHREKVRGMLSECRTSKSIDEMWRNLKALTAGTYKDPVEPLPGQGISVREDTDEDQLNEGEKISKSLARVRSLREGVNS